MGDAVYTVSMDLINLAIHMMPTFIYLDPKRSHRGNIATISTYLQVIMISIESIFYISPQVFFVFQDIFSCLCFLVLLVFFKGTLLRKGFLYISAWLFAVLSTSLSEFTAWTLRRYVSLAYGRTCMVMPLLWACGFYRSVRFQLRGRVSRLFDQLSKRPYSLLLTHPSVSLFILLIGNNTIFSPCSLTKQGLEDMLFYLALRIMILVLYVLALSGTLEVMRHRRVEEELQFARQLISQQRGHYNQTLDCTRQVRVIRHDFHHHIHTLLNVDRGKRTNYLMNLKRGLDMVAEMMFCQNQAVNGLLQEYAIRARQDGVEFIVRVNLSAYAPANDLALCVITDNPLKNTLEAHHRLTGSRLILVQARWLDDHPMVLMENSHNGQIKKNGSRVLSSKRDGGLGILSIRRILDRPGDEFGMDYNDTTFTTMVKIVNRALGQDIPSSSLPTQDKVKALQSS